MSSTSVGEIDLGLCVNQVLFNRQIKGIAKGVQPTIVNAFKPIGRLIGSVLAAGSIVKFTKSCLDLGSDLTEVQNVVDTTFKTLKDDVNQFAENAMESFGMSETVAKQYMGTLGAMSKSMGFSEHQAYDMAKAVTGLTGDVASFYNLSTDEAFNKLKSIWTGETETLKSIGVLLTQTNLDQYALNNGLGKTTASMTEQEKAMLRYRYVMSSLADASGDFAKTSGSWANQTRILSLRFDALKATLGQGFINLFTPIIQMINSLLAKLQLLAQQFKAFTEMLTGNRNEGSGIAAMAADTADVAAGLGSIEQAAKKAAKANRLLGIDEINKAANSSVVADTGVIGTAAADIQMLTAATEPTKGLIGEVSTGLEALTKKIEPFTSALKRLWGGGLSKLGKFTVTGFKDFYESFLVPIGTWAFGTEDKGLSRLIDIINEDLCGVDWDTINLNLKNFWIAIEPYAENFGEGLIDFFEAAADIGFDILDKLFGKEGLLVDLTEWLNGNDPEVARDWGHAFGVLAVSLFLFKKLKPVFSILGNLIGVFGKLFVIPNIVEALTSLGGLTGLFTTDLATVFGAGTATEIGLTIGTGILGGLAGAFAGGVVGKLLDNYVLGPIISFFDEDLGNYYKNFSWFGEGGFLKSLNIEDAKMALRGSLEESKSLFSTFVEEIKRLGEEGGIDFSDGIIGPLNKAVNWDEFPNWWNNNVSPWFTEEKWSGLFQNIKSSALNKWKEIKDWWTTSTLVVWWKNDVSPWFTREKWSGIFHNIRSALTDKWNSIKQWWDNNALTKWWRESVSPWFSKEKWLGGMAGIKDGFKEAFKNACNAGIEIFNRFIGWVNDKMNISWGAISVLGQEVIPAGNMKLLNISSIPMLAEGGYVGPNQPQLAMIGDNRRHGEIVSPEDKMLEIMLAALEQFFSRLHTGQQAPVTENGDIIIPIHIGQEKIDEIIVTAQQRRNMRSGGR